MLLAPLIMYAAVVGFIVVGLATIFLNTKGPWDSLSMFFLVVFMFSWGTGLWFPSFGPSWLGISWLPVLFAGVFMALVLTAAIPRSARRRRVVVGVAATAKKLEGQVAAEKEFEKEFDIYFGILILVLAAIIFCNYYWHSHPT